MFRWRMLFSLLVPCAVSPMLAQTAARPVDPAFVRAQALVSDGNGVAGRALIDSVLAVTPTNAPLYPQGLFWRATLASNAADAESDYKHIVVDYPLAPQAEDALLRLAQLELARGDRDAALGHLQRIPRDYPRSKSLARASYWTARVLFEKNDIPNACAANTDALSQAGADEIELRNQIQYQGQRCPLKSAQVISMQPASDSVPRKISDSAAVAVPSAVSKLPATPAVSKLPAAPTSESPKVKAVTEVPSRPVTDASDSIPPASVAAKKTATTPAKTLPSSASPSAGAGYSVQVAAYNHKPDADKLVTSLVKRGYQARVDGDTVPFRVRIGRYSSEREAEDALKRIKAKHMDGFVVRAPQR